MTASHLRGLIVLSILVIVVAAVAGAGVEFLAGALIGGVISLVLAFGYLVNPLWRVRDAAQQIARSDTPGRIRQRPPGPAGQMADALNQVADRFEAQTAAASEGQSRLAAALNSSVDPVAALDAEGHFLFANKAFEELFQRRLADIAGRPFVHVLADERVVDSIRASRERGDRSTNVVELPGRLFYQVVTTPIGGGGEWAVLLVLHDLTDTQRTDQIRRDFVANVSHELRTPLAALKSVVETLSEGALEDEAVAREFLGRADVEVDRLVQLVEELLELSRIESGEQPLIVSDTDVAVLLSDAVNRLRPQANRAGLRLELDVAPDLGLARIDGARIERAVLNLLHNAIKFTPSGGEVRLSGRRDGDSFVVEVRDTGIGIDQADLGRVFERFYKTDHSRASGGGSGLGLALVKHAVEAHGGSVEVESALNQGSLFSVRIPLAG